MIPAREVAALRAIETMEALVNTFEAMPEGSEVPARDVAALVGSASLAVRAALPEVSREILRRD